MNSVVVEELFSVLSVMNSETIDEDEVLEIPKGRAPQYAR